jgi:oligoendopeptidase F
MLTRAAAGRGLAMLGIDVSPRMIALARSRTKPQIEVHYRVGDIMSAELGPGGFDVVISINMRHHLPLTATVPRLTERLEPPAAARTRRTAGSSQDHCSRSPPGMRMPSMSHHRCPGGLLLAATALCGELAAQAPPFDPFPGGIASRYQFDLARNFFATPDDELAARRSLVAGAEALGRASDSLTAAMRRDPAAFDRVLSDMDSLYRLAGKHFAYLSLRTILDSRDTAAAAASQSLSRALAQLGFVPSAVAAIPPATFDRWTATNAGVARWSEYVRRAREGAPRVNQVRSDSASALVGPLTGWQAGAFQDLLRAIDFGTVATPDGVLDVRTRASDLMNHPDQTVRERWYRQNRRGLESQRDSFAVLLTTIVQGRNEVARLRGFEDHREESYGARGLSTAGVGVLLERGAAASDLNRRYERARNAHLRAVAGLDTVWSWDLVLPEPGMAVPRFTILEASALMRGALRPLGPAYAAELDALLDPANGRMDLLPRPFRAERQGFSTGSVGYPSVFFQGRFSGYLDDVIVFAHEAGHSVQNMLMERRRVPAVYSGGPDFFTESFAGLNELLITDYLHRSARSRAERIYHLQRFLDQATEIFKTAREALFEHELYAVEDPAHLTAEDLEARMQAAGRRFSTWFGAGSHRTMEWVNAVHFYTRPLYRVNYLYSKLLALGYFAELERDPGWARRYERLLSNGYDAPPNELLGRLVGLPLAPDALVDRATAVIGEKLAALDSLYQE